MRRKRDDHILLIPELCNMTGLTDKMKADFRLMKAVAQHTKLIPEERRKKVLEFVSELNRSVLIVVGHQRFFRKISFHFLFFFIWLLYFKLQKETFETLKFHCEIFWKLFEKFLKIFQKFFWKFFWWKNLSIFFFFFVFSGLGLCFPCVRIIHSPSFPGIRKSSCSSRRGAPSTDRNWWSCRAARWTPTQSTRETAR